MRRIASAPGKVVLSGEYAVLEGAPAVAMAVDRRAVVEIETAANAPHWDTGGSDTSLIDAVIRSVGVRSVVAGRTDTSAFRDRASGRKLGLGSSAALAVALTAALTDRENVLFEALRAHSAWQGGTGSGVDVACSSAGGLVTYTRDGADARRMAWPQGLHARVTWSGVTSSTKEKLRGLDRRGRSWSTLAVHARQTASAWASADASDVLLSYPDYIAALRAFSVDHDLGIFDAGHDALVDAAQAEKLVYKPCGAGGGDVGIVLSDDVGRIDAFIATRQLQVLDCALDPDGVRLG